MEPSPESFFYYSLYEAGLWAAKRWPWLPLAPGYINIMDTLRPYWQLWKVKATIEAVDKQAVEIVKQWEVEDRQERAEALATKAKELFPEASVTALPDAIVPSVMIIHEADESASEGVKALGGELRITWQLPS